MNLTRLEAVNRILRGAMEHPVASLEDSEINDTLMAEQVLDEALLREQLTGWHVNTVEEDYTPDADNSYQIVLPTTVIQVQGVNENVNRNLHWKEISEVTYLFDVDEATTEFPDDTTIRLRISTYINFEDLPPQYQFSVVDQAAVEYQEAVHGSPSQGQVLSARAARSRAIARAYDMRMRPKNQFANGRSAGPRIGRWVPRHWPYQF